MKEGIVSVLKPPGMSSSDVVGDIRRLFQEKRVGHLGTLDPGAAGVLPVCVGRAVRLFDYLVDKEKTYRFELLFGRETDTQDVYGRVTDRTEKNLSRQELEGLLPRFRGEIIQQAPAYSALKSGGKKLYDLALAGKEIPEKLRPVTISRLELLEQTGENRYLMEVTCSRGTYVRTLCHDIGQALGCGGCMSSLRRTMAAGFTLAECRTIEEVQQQGESLLAATDSLFRQYPAYRIPSEQADRRCRCGNPLTAEGLQPGLYRVYGTDGTFLCLSRWENGVLTSEKNFFGA